MPKKPLGMPEPKRAMNLLNAFAEQVAASPDTYALIETRKQRDQVLSYSELDVYSSKMATVLKAKGITKGDRVLLLRGISKELYGALLALFRIGAVAVFPDPSTPVRQIREAIQTLKPKAVIGEPIMLIAAMSLRCLRAIPVKVTIGASMPFFAYMKLEEVSPDPLIEHMAEDSEALVTFTSGSTGHPKIIVRSHAFLIEQYRVLHQTLELKSGQRDLSTLPVFVLANLGSGVTSILPDTDVRKPAKVNVHKVVKQVERLKPSRCTAAPAFFKRLLEASTAFPWHDFKRIDTGGGPVTPELIKQISEVAPNATITAVYGSSEAEPIAEISAPLMMATNTSSGIGLPIGKPVAAISCKVIQDHWGQPFPKLSEVELCMLEQETFAAGEIVVSGSHVLQGYLNGVGDEETKITVDGTVWHRTGDAGYFDDRKQLWLLGRASAKVMVQGQQIYPLQVESLITGLSDRLKCALISVDDCPILAVQAKKSGADPSIIQQCLKENNMSGIKVVLIPKLPMDRRHNSKVDYNRLKKLLRNLI